MVILPSRPSLGEILGNSLSDYASHWAQDKMTRQALKDLNFSDAEARAYSILGPQAQQQALHARQQQQQQAASNQAINSILGEGLQTQNPYFQPTQSYHPQMQQQGVPQTQLPRERQQAAIQEATSIAQNPAFRKLNEQQQQAQLQQQQLAQQLNPRHQVAQQATPEQQAIIQAQSQKEPSFKDQINQLRRQKAALAVANLPPQQRLAIQQQLDNREKELRKEDREERRESREEKKFEHEKQKEANKQSEAFFHKVNDQAKAARESNDRLGKMEKLINSGNLNTPYFVRTVRALGELPFGLGKLWNVIGESMLHPDTEEFEKLSTDFLTGAKPYFGSNMTQGELELFLKRVPSSVQTNVGKKRVMNNMRILNEAADLYQKTMFDVIKENGGKRPADLEIQVEQKIAPKQKELSDRFREGIYQLK